MTTRTHTSARGVIAAIAALVAGVSVAGVIPRGATIFGGSFLASASAEVEHANVTTRETVGDIDW
jgi:hypothetical protein